MQKDARHKKILEIVSGAGIRRQDEFTAALRRDGIDVTQASVSRDLDELGIVKINGVYAIQAPSNGSDIFGLVSIETAGDALIIAKCASGLASAAAVRIDASKLSNIIGTIAGDDTIFIAVKNASDQKNVVRSLYALFSSENKEGENDSFSR